MKLDKRATEEIAEKCAKTIIENYGEKKLVSLPYDVLSAEISEMVDGIEDKIDKIITSRIEESTTTHTIEELWED